MTSLPASPAFEDEIASYLERGLEHLWVHTQQATDLAQEDGLKVFTRGEGIYLWDMKGRQFIDAMSGLWVVNAGHGRAELAETAAKQMREMAYVNTFAYTSRPAIDLATKLASLLPPSINKLFFVNSGSEAVETAIRMAKHYQYNIGEKKRYKVLARRGSYHGTTAGALSVNGSAMLNRAPWEPLLPGVVFVENVNCYRCPFEKTFPACDTFCARTIERTIQAERPETIAAFIAEPISAANAVAMPPPDYWPAIRRLCDKYGILLIADEVINGFGRTGKWFASELYDFEPDLMTMAKGLSSGYLPIAALGISDKVAKEFEGDKSRTFGGGITFGTHPVACAVALANLEIIEREGLVENSARNGAYLQSRLNGLKERHPTIGEVRGRGLLLGVEIVKDPATKELFPESADLPGKLTAALIKNGILCRAGNVVNFAPPLVISEAQCDDLADRFDAALAETEQQFGIV
ncbi:MAG: aspartate aminotransferase family protein [Anaerolinea sp.]|nr:aspartate aminotransferase family protein [Anaerolinea sp.]